MPHRGELDVGSSPRRFRYYCNTLTTPTTTYSTTTTTTATTYCLLLLILILKLPLITTTITTTVFLGVQENIVNKDDSFREHSK